MKRMTLLTGSLSFFFILFVMGCGSSSSVPFYGAHGQNYLQIQTNVSSPAEAWPNATITGYANADTLGSACDVSTDTNCIPEVGSTSPYAVMENGIQAFNTNSNGLANFGTDAFSASWNFYASDNNSSQCNGGSASTTTASGVSTGSMVSLTCGQNDADMISTPSSCIINETVTPYTSTCPSTITLNFPPPASSEYSLPLNTALVSSLYDNTGSYSGQNSVSATTSTSIVVPRPDQNGTAYIAVNDPSTGKVYGVAEFSTIVVFPPTSPPPPHQNP